MAFAFCEWGLAGIERFRGKVSAIILVDVLSFSTAVDVGVSRGAAIYPFPHLADDSAQREAQRRGLVLARPRGTPGAAFSLSPASFENAPRGLRVLLPSLNGSRLSLACGQTPVLTGCLRNAVAIARAAKVIAGAGDIAVISAGERWPDDTLRPAVEDFLGAGAILNALDLPCSAEAQVAQAAFRTCAGSLDALIRESISGRELIDGGFPADVDMALAVNTSATAPVLQDGAYGPYRF